MNIFYIILNHVVNMVVVFVDHVIIGEIVRFPDVHVMNIKRIMKVIVVEFVYVVLIR